MTQREQGRSPSKASTSCLRARSLNRTVSQGSLSVSVPSDSDESGFSGRCGCSARHSSSSPARELRSVGSRRWRGREVRTVVARRRVEGPEPRLAARRHAVAFYHRHGGDLGAVLVDALGRRALVAVARLRDLDEHLVRDDVRRRRVDSVLRRVRVGQEEALDLGERDGDRRRRVGRRRERPDAVPRPLGPDLGRGGGRDLRATEP